MTALDWGLLLIVGLSAILGMARGLIGVAVSLAAWLLAGVGAFLFGGEVGRSLGDGQMGWASYMGGYALAFVAIWITVGLIGLVIRRIAHSYGLSEMDRLMGLGLGTIRGLIFACALLVTLGMTTLPRERAWRESSLAALLMPGAKLMRSGLPDAMARKVDLEGRGTSLQATVQSEAKSLEKNLKQQVPQGIPGGMGGFGGGGGGLADLIPAGLGGANQGNNNGNINNNNGSGGLRDIALPQPLPEEQASGGLQDLLPGAMRDLLPRGAGGQGAANRTQGDPARVDPHNQQDDKRVN
ncbi:CvpA family protein [Lysobacter capsici]|uniref:CvpA family protein n=1 Tax=Lysobacter capsici TaxID=435897 RepID=UPI001C006CA7|nr:CvpA family protein [Lysobacter capsici]QWF15695.1 CvpA family protein [Lysobacter capsici]